MNQNILFEIHRRSITINKIEESTISWQKNVLAVRHDKGIQMYEFSHNLECIDKNIDCSEIHVPTTKTSPAEKLFSGQVFDRYTPNMLYTDMLLEPAMWAHNPTMLDDLVNISHFSWSPVGFIQNNESALAILNNVGQVDIIAPKENRWVNVFNLSPYLSHSLKIQASMSPQILKQEAFKVSICAMSWAPVLNPNRTCFFVTAQKDGSLYFWCIQNIDLDVKASLIGETKCECFEINSILWVPKTNTEFWLICPDVTGEIIGFECSFENNCIIHKNENNLWPHKDKMIAHNLNYFTIDNKYVLIYSKHRHLIVQVLDKSLRILVQYVKNVNDYRIKNITNTLDAFYISTSNCEIFKIDVYLMDTKLDVVITKQEVKEKDLGTSYEMLGAVFSPNKIICAMIMFNRQIWYRKLRNRIETCFMTTENTMDNVFSVLLDNPTKSLLNYRDCLNLLRYRTMKLKELPSADYDKLYQDGHTDVYKMKLYLICLILHNKLKSIMNISMEPPLPETSIEKVKDFILLNHATKTINNLYEILNENGHTEFQIECFNGCKMFIEDYCERNERKVQSVLHLDLIRFVTESEILICQCCDEQLNRFSCKEGHLNMFCSLTFTQINSDEYLVCKACNATARSELYTIDPMCVFCDLYLQKIYRNT